MSRLFAVTALLFASVDGVLAIWSRQASGGDLGIGLVIAVVAVIVLTANWLRTAWWRD